MEFFIYLLEIIGTVAFAVSGAMVAMKKETDIFGVVFIAITTALGGGVIRDLLIGIYPPAAFKHYEYVVLSSVTALIVFGFAYTKRHNDGRSHWDSINRVNNIFDAVGLGTFTVIGMSTVISENIGGNAFTVVFLGMITGIGGGIIRDTLVREVPVVLKEKIYAVASLMGAIFYYILFSFGINLVICNLVGIISIFVIRMTCSKYNWHLPRVCLK